MIVAADNDMHPSIHVINSAYKIPEIAVRATNDAFQQKRSYPMMTRLFPTSSSITQAMSALIASFNYTGALLITTKDSDVSASAITMTQQLTDLGLINVRSLSIPLYPTAADLNATVDTVIATISQFQIRPIVLLTTATTGLQLLAVLGAKKVYGPDLIYFLSYDVTRPALGRLADPIADPIVNGAYGFIPQDVKGTNVTKLFAQWQNLSRVDFPGQQSKPQSQSFVYDTPWTYAYALQSVLDSGVAFDKVKYTDILAAVYNVSFMGISGPVAYDSNRDYIASNGQTVYNIKNISAFNYLPVALYIPVGKSGNLVKTGNYTFYDGSSVPPNPGYCPFCFNGTCNAQSICVCNVGYTGEYCSELIRPEKNYNTILQIIIPIAVFAILVLAAVAIYFNRRRKQMLKEISERQRSNIPRSEIKLLDRIGRGASGTVYKAMFRGTDVAAKSILTGSSSSAAVEEFKMETAIMCALRHPNIVLFMGSCFDEAQKEMLLVMEFCSRGSLHDLLNDPKVTLQYELLLHLACQSAQGMNFLHESIPPIIHRDLKSHNILLDDKFNAKISDFGLTRFKDSKKTKASHESLGTVFWTAPEVLNGAVHTEKSDCYSFGVVLWEMFHRSDPYPNMDLVTVAMEVMNKQIRPIMDPSTPPELQSLIRDCWHQDPEKRPTFNVIMTRLRALTMQHPMYSFAMGHQSRVEAPTGNVFIVHSKIKDLYPLFDVLPRPANKAYTLHNHLLRSTLELYGGYEVKMTKDGFYMVFPSCHSAIDWCIATQISLLRLKWPQEILEQPQATKVEVDGQVMWCGLRVQMSIHCGTPDQDMDANGRITYSGPVVDIANSILKSTHRGTILITNEVLGEVGQKKFIPVEQFTTSVCEDKLSNGAEIHELLPSSLAKRVTTSESSNYVISLEETNNETTITFDAGLPQKLPDWLIPFRKLQMKDSIGKGQVGDYSRATYNSSDVVVKLLVNQKLREEDQLSLISDCSILYRVRHPNLVNVQGVCLKRNHVSIIMDFVDNGNLHELLQNTTIPVTHSQLISIAKQIAVGMVFLTTYEDKALRIHDNFKSNNILLTKDFQVKITDYGQTNIKDLARTMTSISSVAWTAPEILNGEPLTEQSSVYAFGIILWEMFARKIPYQGEHPLKVITKILAGYRPPVPADCPQGIKTLMQNCLNGDPELRPTWPVIQTELNYL